MALSHLGYYFRKLPFLLLLPLVDPRIEKSCPRWWILPPCALMSFSHPPFVLLISDINGFEGSLPGDKPFFPNKRAFPYSRASPPPLELEGPPVLVIRLNDLPPYLALSTLPPVSSPKHFPITPFNCYSPFPPCRVASPFQGKYSPPTISVGCIPTHSVVVGW